MGEFGRKCNVVKGEMLTLTKSPTESNYNPPRDTCASGLTHNRWTGLGTLPDMALPRLSSPVVLKRRNLH